MEKLKVFFTAISTALAYIFGGMDKMLAILLVFIAIDFISGVVIYKSYSTKGVR